VQHLLADLVNGGELRRVRKGLYWRGTNTPLGMSPPPTHASAAEVSGNKGVGPAGLSAANLLRLSTRSLGILVTVFIGASASTARHLPVATTAPLAAKVELAHGTAMAVTGSAALLALALVVVALVIPRSAAPTGPRASALP
jgi:hypothetical protein